MGSRTRMTLTVLGLAAIAVYSFLGAMLMIDWAVSTASGVSLATAIAAMDAAGQPYSAVPGIIFASVGGLLALAWAVVVLHRKTRIPGPTALSIWAGIIALGAPAYFFLAFGNLNSVGDTFVDWNHEAAFALEAPLYVASGIAALVAVAALLAAVFTARRPRSINH